jgi:oligopeptide/dipeptide ABC transporter ATP-binding protein
VEQALVEDLFTHPLHPYTRGLLDSLPRVGAARTERLRPIPGTVPPLTRLPSGCRFRDRCSWAIGDCARIDPPLEEKSPGHTAACIRVTRGEAAERSIEARP